MKSNRSSTWHEPKSALFPGRVPALRRGRLLLFVCAVAFMVFLTTLEGAILRSSRGQPVDWPGLVQGRILAWGTCAFFVPPLYLLTRRLPVARNSWRAAVPAHLAASVLAAAGKYALYLPLVSAAGNEGTRPWMEVVRANFLGEMMFYWAMIGLAHALVFHDRRWASATTPAREPGKRPEPKADPGPSRPAPEDADWIEAEGNYVLLHVGSGRIMVRQTLSSLERTLPPHFLRVHRSAIVNLDRVRRVMPGPRGTWRFLIGAGVAVASGRAYRNRLEAAVAGFKRPLAEREAVPEKPEPRSNPA